jgi:hypothetical protein
MSSFTAATWNLGGGEPVGPTDAAVRRVLTSLKVEHGVDLLLVQEGQEKFDRALVEELWPGVHSAGPECMVAWSPDKFPAAVNERDTVLNPENPFFRKNGSRPIFCHMPQVILVTRWGRTVDVGSYHLPSSVQQANKPPNRIAATREAMAIMARIQRRNQCDAVLLGGDDNVDEEQGAFGPWAFMLYEATGLRQVVAPSNTLGHRSVDDFREDGLVVVGDGEVIHGPTHHNPHIRKFRFRAA